MLFAFCTFSGEQKLTLRRACCLRVLCKNMRITWGKTKNCEDVRATRAPNIPADIGLTMQDFPYNTPLEFIIFNCCIMRIASLQRLSLTPGGAHNTKKDRVL